MNNNYDTSLKTILEALMMPSPELIKPILPESTTMTIPELILTTTFDEIFTTTSEGPTTISDAKAMTNLKRQQRPFLNSTQQLYRSNQTDFFRGKPNFSEVIATIV